MPTLIAQAKLRQATRLTVVDKKISASLTSAITITCLGEKVKRTIIDLDCVSTISLTPEKFLTIGGSNFTQPGYFQRGQRYQITDLGTADYNLLADTTGVTYQVGSVFTAANSGEIVPSITGVAISGTAGQFTCTATRLVVGNKITITGTFGPDGTGTITDYTTEKVYTISAITGSGSSVTGFTLTDGGTAIVTTVGTPTGLTYTAGPLALTGRAMLTANLMTSTLTCKFPTYIRIDLEALGMDSYEGQDCIMQLDEGVVIQGIYPGSEFTPNPPEASFMTFRIPKYFRSNFGFGISSTTTLVLRIKQLASSLQSAASLSAFAQLNPGKFAALVAGISQTITTAVKTARGSSALSSILTTVINNTRLIDRSIDSIVANTATSIVYTFFRNPGLSAMPAITAISTTANKKTNVNVSCQAEVQTNTNNSRLRDHNSNMETQLSVNVIIKRFRIGTVLEFGAFSLSAIPTITKGSALNASISSSLSCDAEIPFKYVYPLNLATDPTSATWRSAYAPSGYVFIPNYGIITIQPLINTTLMFQGNTTFNTNISSWDMSTVTVMNGMFNGCTAFNQNCNAWDTSSVEIMAGVFTNCTSYNQPLNTWDTSNVQSMASMFQGASAFNQPLNNWDTSNVISMNQMFRGATIFNQNLNSWNTSSLTNTGSMFNGAFAYNQPMYSWTMNNVTTLASMFNNAIAFNQDISAWNTSSNTSLFETFRSASAFNQPLNSWNTSNVITMVDCFRAAYVFNQPLNSWNTSNVTVMSHLFAATQFNQNINSWDVSKVVYMDSMFTQTPFNQPLNSWNVGLVQDMNRMFYFNSAFNQDISAWNTGNVINFENMFEDATAFNQPLNTWDTSNVSTFTGMFDGASAFNRPLNNWDVSNAPLAAGNGIRMARMFRDATSYNQDLSSWCVPSRATEPPGFSTGATAWVLPKPVWGTCPP